MNKVITFLRTVVSTVLIRVGVVLIRVGAVFIGWGQYLVLESGELRQPEDR